MFQKKNRKLILIVALTTALLLAITSIALADHINIIGGAPESITLTAGGTATVDIQLYVQATGGDEDSQCNFDPQGGSEHLTFSINTPSGVTASPSSLTFNYCHDQGDKNYQTVQFSAGASAESGDISFTETENNSGGSFDYDNAVFYISIETPPPMDDQAPTADPTQDPPANGAGWNNTDVTVNWNWSDNAGGSGIDAANCTTSSTSSGEGTIKLTATCKDLAGNEGSAEYTVYVDKTGPIASASASPAPNGNGWNNTDVTVSFSGDDGTGSGIDFCSDDVVLSDEGADQSASGTCTDMAGNVSNLATASGINIDKTAPTASASASPAANANGWNNTDVTVSFSGDDGTGSGIDFCSDDVVLSDEGADQSASGTCTDMAGNVSNLATASGINIDKTAPTVSLVGGPADGGSYYFGFVPAAPTCSASDALSGLDGSCSVSGYSAAVGTHTVTASAKDKAGNTASDSHEYEVLAWTLNGFFQPVDMPPVLNTVKGGSTVPLKFEIFAGDLELTDTSDVKGFTATAIACPTTGYIADPIEVLATGRTSLRYDPIAGQFVYNWQTPKTPGSCYSVTMTTLDDSTLTAYFKLK
jgi:hypothetical protein